MPQPYWRQPRLTTELLRIGWVRRSTRGGLTRKCDHDQTHIKDEAAVNVHPGSRCGE